MFWSFHTMVTNTVSAFRGAIKDLAKMPNDNFLISHKLKWKEYTNNSFYTYLSEDPAEITEITGHPDPLNPGCSGMSSCSCLAGVDVSLCDNSNLLKFQTLGQDAFKFYLWYFFAKCLTQQYRIYICYSFCNLPKSFRKLEASKDYLHNIYLSS